MFYSCLLLSWTSVAFGDRLGSAQAQNRHSEGLWDRKLSPRQQQSLASGNLLLAEQKRRLITKETSFTQNTGLVCCHERISYQKDPGDSGKSDQKAASDRKTAQQTAVSIPARYLQ